MTTKQKKTITRSPKLGVIRTHYGTQVRHITMNTHNVEPLCSEKQYHYMWAASTAKDTHKLPLCKNCTNIVTGLYGLLQRDNGYLEATIGKEKMVEQSRAELLALIADYEDEYGEITDDEMKKVWDEG